MQNKPNLGHRGKMSGGDARPPIRSGAGSTRRRNVQNEANFGRCVTWPVGVSLETGVENDIMGGVAWPEGFGDRGFRAVVGRAGEGSS